ncbi:growth-regulating factor 2 [Actinidia rufa]|uniref:Growth-regulating factor n=1 Tax=Actinidia rufa TaxID=165716 RepID=A0A7J0EHL0_9ERIC|nr:growth-regulating factor 2 [Actinidia rufa]
MDLGMVGFNGLVGSDTCIDSDPETKHKWYGSGFLKQEGPEPKVAKTDVVSANSKALLRSSSSFLSHGQQMLSFSEPSSENVSLPNYYHHTSSRNTGYGYGGLNASSMHGVLSGVRSPFTPSQWMELEHQALIYKYITANVPVPSNLLIPIRKALDSTGLSGFSVGPLRSSTLGWGAFHLGYSNNSDPEPGRCRRTDGKKWRCSRDAVVDQKYCERHMNRGRHRSRKPVEGLNGHSVSGPTTTTAKPSSTSALVVPGGGASNSLGFSHHPHHKNLQSNMPSTCASSPQINRIFLNKENVGERNEDATNFSIPKQHNPYEESSRADFGRVCSDSLLNPLQNSFRNYGSSQDLNARENESQRSVHQFMDDWPKTQTDRVSFTWPIVDLQAERTQLSISIPEAPLDFTSSSPSNEKLALSPLRLSRDLDTTQRQANWIPISWETSMGGPLGEVLHSTNSSVADCKNSSALNLMTDGWEGSPRLASSPTGVLQKMTFGSLSNSSAGSSPRAESHKTHEFTLVNSSSLPIL